MNLLSRLRNFFRMKDTRNNLWVILIAAVLFQVILVAQHIYTHRLLDNELDHSAESGLRLKAILTKGMLNSAESILHDFEWDIQRNLHNPDSIVNAAYWLVMNHQHVTGSAMCFVPYYYPEKGRLYEPFAGRMGDTVMVSQIAGPHHDYTTMDFYRKGITENRPHWSDPYIDSVRDNSLICTYTIPIHDQEDRMAGIFCLDISLDWLSDTINARHSHPSTFNLLLTEDGKVIVNPPEDHVKFHDVDQVVRLINDSTVYRTPSVSQRTNTISFKSEHDGSTGSIYYANMRGLPHWQVVTVCYDNELFGKLNQMTLNVSLMMIASLLILAYIIRHYRRNALRLHEADIVQERIGSELRVASSIQQSMLTQSSGNNATRDDIDAYGVLHPAREVGGDLYEYFVRDEKLYFCIGDVSGKGVPASLVMAVTLALFRAGADHSSQPSHIMQTINQGGCRNNIRNMFVTLFIGVLDLPTGRLRYCNAGHDAPVLIADGKPQLLDVMPNLPIGVIEDFKYTTQQCQLNPGTALLLYTDGLTEAMNAQHEQYRLQRMLDYLTGNHITSSTQLIESLTADVRQFVDGAEQSDDLTMLAIRYTPHATQDVLRERLTLSNDVSQVKQLNAFVDSVTGKLGLDTTLCGQMRLAVEEAVVNVMEYAYPAGTKGDIEVTALSDGHDLRFVITDSGKPFNPTEKERADTTLSVDERPIGGLGILLVREMMDSINYERIDGKNVLSLRKILPETFKTQ